MTHVGLTFPVLDQFLIAERIGSFPIIKEKTNKQSENFRSFQKKMIDVRRRHPTKSSAANPKFSL